MVYQKDGWPTFCKLLYNDESPRVNPKINASVFFISFQLNASIVQASPRSSGSYICITGCNFTKKELCRCFL